MENENKSLFCGFSVTQRTLSQMDGKIFSIKKAGSCRFLRNFSVCFSFRQSFFLYLPSIHHRRKKLVSIFPLCFIVGRKKWCLIKGSSFRHTMEQERYNLVPSLLKLTFRCCFFFSLWSSIKKWCNEYNEDHCRDLLQ